MMFIKVHDLNNDDCIINASHIICLAYDGSVTTIGLTNKLSLCVSETPEEIMELLKAEDPLREKILDQMDNIDNMLDSMEKDKCQYYDLLRALSKRVLNWSFGMEREKPENEEHYNYPCDTCAFEDTGANSFPCSICKPGPGLLWVSKEEVDNENKD